MTEFRAESGDTTRRSNAQRAQERTITTQRDDEVNAFADERGFCLIPRGGNNWRWRAARNNFLTPLTDQFKRVFFVRMVKQCQTLHGQ